jgi:hypothetical protein
VPGKRRVNEVIVSLAGGWPARWRRFVAPGLLKKRGIYLVLLIAVGVSGCESVPDLYSWGSYRDSVMRVAGPTDAFDLQAEIARLTADMQQISDEQKRIPPGFALHLAYLHLLQGDRSRAAELMALEKVTFPESTHFVDGVMTRALNQPDLPVPAGTSSAAGNPEKQQ